MQYKNGQRQFRTLFSSPKSHAACIKDTREYYLVEDIDTKVEFFLPEHAIKDMTYVFSWDRYLEDRDDAKVLKTLKEELSRLEAITSGSVNVEKGKEHMRKFIAEMEA